MEGATVVAKFEVQEEKRTRWNPQGREVTLRAVHFTDKPEDQRFSKATPTGNLTMTVDNPAALANLLPEGELGQQFYLYFVPVPK